MKLIIIIPAFNEEKTIAQVIQEIPRNIEGINELQILVIDDGSTDNTVKEAKNAGASVVSHIKNEGLGIAFSTGIGEALKQGADIVVNIDADGQFDSKEIPKLVKPILEKKAEMAAGSRFEDKTSLAQVPFLKRWGNKAFTSLINILTNQRFTDTQCGFRAYSKEALLRLNLFGRFTYTQEVFLDLANKGLKIEQVPIKVRYYKERQAKISSSLLGYFLRTIIIILRTFRDYKPLVFFGIPGVSIFGAGIIFWLYSFIYWLIHFQTTPVRMYFFVGLGLLIFGFLLIILALIADMLKRLRQNQEEILYKLKKKEYEEKINMMMYNEALNILWKAYSFEASVALLTLERCVNGTIIQWNRIQTDKRALLGPGPGVDQTLMLTLFLDIHFYFVCYDKAQNLLKYLAETDGDERLKDLWQTYEPKFKPFNDARNHLEHIETRIRKEYLSDFGNLENDIFTFGGERFDISASGLKLLTGAYEQVLGILRSRPKNNSTSSI